MAEGRASVGPAEGHGTGCGIGTGSMGFSDKRQSSGPLNSPARTVCNRREAETAAVLGRFAVRVADHLAEACSWDSAARTSMAQTAAVY